MKTRWFMVTGIADKKHLRENSLPVRSLSQLMCYNRLDCEERTRAVHSGRDDQELTDHDLAHLADWANQMKNTVSNPDWKRAYALLREGADMLLRRRAMGRVDKSTAAWESELTATG